MFEIHFAPDYETFLPPGQSHGHYPYFNKPFGLLDWMKQGKIMNYIPDSDTIENEDDIVILCVSK